jgi:hypothetical protein
VSDHTNDAATAVRRGLIRRRLVLESLVDLAKLFGFGIDEVQAAPTDILQLAIDEITRLRALAAPPASPAQGSACVDCGVSIHDHHVDGERVICPSPAPAGTEGERVPVGRGTELVCGTCGATAPVVNGWAEIQHGPKCTDSAVTERPARPAEKGPDHA